jgi:hypothetical protein
LCRLLQPPNAYDAFALFSRTVNTEFVRFYGASFADTLNVAAFTCVRKLGGIVDIPTSCHTDNVPLYVRSRYGVLPVSSVSHADAAPPSRRQAAIQHAVDRDVP